jgi:hypothetical protein
MWRPSQGNSADSAVGSRIGDIELRDGAYLRVRYRVDGHAGQMIRKVTLAHVACLGLEPVDEIDHVVKPSAGMQPRIGHANEGFSTRRRRQARWAVAQV